MKYQLETVVVFRPNSGTGIEEVLKEAVKLSNQGQKGGKIAVLFEDMIFVVFPLSTFEEADARYQRLKETPKNCRINPDFLE